MAFRPAFSRLAGSLHRVSAYANENSDCTTVNDLLSFLCYPLGHSKNLKAMGASFGECVCVYVCP